MTLTLPAPASLHGDQLLKELRAAGAEVDRLVLEGDDLEIHGTADATVVRRVLAAHVPQSEAAAPSLTDRLAAVEARLDKAAAASVTGDAAKLRDNLKPAT